MNYYPKILISFITPEGETKEAYVEAQIENGIVNMPFYYKDKGLLYKLGSVYFTINKAIYDYYRAE